MKDSDLPRTRAALERGIEQKLHVGAQAYASVAGEVRGDFAIGEARRGVSLTEDSLMLWMSSVKPATVVAILQLAERGLLALDDLVCRHIPEFAAGGKDGITLRHVLTHTGGFPAVAAPWRDSPWDEILAEICASPLVSDWVPGERCAYHVASGWYVLGEMVRRLDGRAIGTYLREEVFVPSGMVDTWVGMPRERYRLYGDRIAPMHATEVEPIPHPYVAWSGSEDGCALCRPGGSGWGPAHDLARLYEMFLAGGEWRGRRVLSRASVDAMTSLQTRGMFDETLNMRLDRGLGVVLDSKPYGPASAWYGPSSSPRAFGHGGFRSSVGFADPEHQLAAAVIFNGMPIDTAHKERVAAVLEALYLDLGFAPAKS